MTNRPSWLPARRHRVVPWRLRSSAALVLVSSLGLLAFGWPLLVEADAALAGSPDGPWLFALVLPLLLAVVVAELSDGGMDAKAVALLGVLTAAGAALRALSGGVTGFQPMFVVIVLGGRVLGPGFGFVLGATSMATSALLTGGVGPWLPFQMLAAAWVGLGAGLLPAARGRGELALLAGYGAGSAVAFGVLLNLWFWPFVTGADGALAFEAGAPVTENLGRLLAFSLATSLAFDLPRALGNAVLILLLGRPGADGAASGVAPCRLRRGGRLLRAHAAFGSGADVVTRIQLLGTGSADGWPNPFCRCASCQTLRARGEVRGHTAALVDDTMLLDLGPEVPRAAERLGASLADVRVVLLTHAHPDHVGPLALLMRHWAGCTDALVVAGPAAALAMCREWLAPDDPVVLTELTVGSDVVLSGYRVEALAARHDGPEAGPALLYRVTTPDGACLLYATDTGPLPDATHRALNGRPLDVAVVELTFGDRIDHGTDHLDLRTLPAELSRLRSAGAIGPSTQVVAVHLSHHNPPDVATVVAPWGVDVLPDGAVIQSGPASSGERPAPPPSRTLVLGGARSGKSAHAEHLLAAEPQVTYVATGGVGEGDAEWQRRVAAHRSRRPDSWTTVETTDLEGVLDAAAPGDVLLVDCLTLWLASTLDLLDCWDDVDLATKRAKERIDALAEAWRTTKAQVVAVSNEVGSGVVPATPSGRLFRDLQGLLNTRVARHSDSVTLVVAGRAARPRLAGGDPPMTLDLAAFRTEVGRPDGQVESAAEQRQLLLTKPTGALGRLEELAAWLCAVQGVCPPRPLARARVVIFAGDHGVAQSGVSAYPPEVTAQMVRTFVSGGAAVNAIARTVDAGVRVLDLGVDADLSDLPAAVTAFKVRRGTGDIRVADAMTRAEAEQALLAGVTVGGRGDRRRRRRPGGRGHGDRQHHSCRGAHRAADQQRRRRGDRAWHRDRRRHLDAQDGRGTRRHAPRARLCREPGRAARHGRRPRSRGHDRLPAAGRTTPHPCHPRRRRDLRRGAGGAPGGLPHLLVVGRRPPVGGACAGPGAEAAAAGAAGGPADAAGRGHGCAARAAGAARGRGDARRDGHVRRGRGQRPQNPAPSETTASGWRSGR